LRRAAPVFDVPVSTAITLSFLLTGRIYSVAPFLLRAILGGAVLIPTALILRRLMDRTLFPILNALLVFYFVDQLRLITAALPLWGRLVFGAEMLGGTLFLIWLIRSKHLSTIGAKTTKPFARVIRVATQIGLIVFPVTLLETFLATSTSPISSEMVLSKAFTLRPLCMLPCGSSKG
jgi:hypothetical protein